MLTCSSFGYVGSWYHLLSSVTSSKKKKKKKLLLNYVLTCSPFGYVGSLVFYAKFSHMSKKKKLFFEPRDDSISLKCNTGKTWYITLSAIIVLGEHHYDIVTIRRQCYRMKANVIVRHCNQKECKVTMKASIIVRMSLGISKM